MSTQAFQNQPAAASQPPSRIVIVGGGTAGWMTAALLSHTLPEPEYSVTVIDAGGGGIGVGEATIPSIIRLLRTLGADEAEFMRACNATWKLGIQFCDWRKGGHNTWHPFGVCGARIDQRDLFSYWLADRQRPYHSYSLNWAASLAGKSPHARNGRSPMATTGAYAFHLDAARLAEWLQRRALSSGAQLVSGRAGQALTDDAGQVLAVTLEDNTSIRGDLFIDCSGFEGRLIGQCPQDTWIDRSNQLLCDRAVAVRRPATRVIQPYTTARALSAGWVWDIPLMDRRGVGYVYSSRFTSDDDALTELLQHVGGNDQAAAGEAKFVRMKTGRRTAAWNMNVIAIGLSAGFVEPLESSGLHLVQIAVERLLEYFPSSEDAALLRSAYNHTVAALFDEVLDFVQLHYLLSDRDEAFWKAAREAAIGPELQHRLRLYDEIGMLDVLQPEAFPDASYYYLLAGNERLPKRPAALSLAIDRERLQFVLQAILEQNKNALRQLPLQEEMLKQLHTAPVARAS
ncbi:MAG: tryptophan 7-halogenase [Fuerstiella sp.]